jgi:hypothetical protein
MESKLLRAELRRRTAGDHQTVHPAARQTSGLSALLSECRATPSSQFGRLCLHVGLLLTEMDGAPRAIGGRFNQPGILQARRLKSQRSQIIVRIQRMAPLYSIGLNGRFRLASVRQIKSGPPF